VPKPLRWFLVNVMIVPRRKGQSARAYQKVQLAEGSPLRVYTQALAEQVAAQLAPDDRYVVEYGMRYGNPSIAASLTRLHLLDLSRIFVLPLYPQYAESSFETAVVETRRVAQKLGCADRLTFFPPFYDRPEFIAAFARRIAEDCEKQSPEHLVFSFHSLPERHLKRLDATRAHCLVESNCCDQISAVNQNCYRAQCVFTARAIAAQLGLKKEFYSISFQSRLGRAKWIGPATVDVLGDLGRRGVKRIAVSCPSFVADCLETVEEMGIRGRETFLAAGGETLHLIPSLNSDPAWVDTVAGWVRELGSLPHRTG